MTASLSSALSGIDGNPEPASGRSQLSAMLETTSAVTHTLLARPGNNLGNPTLIFSIPMSEFFDMSIIANEPELGDVAQRRLDPAHAAKLGVFMLKGLVFAARRANSFRETVADSEFERMLHKLGPQPYAAMQPLVVNIRSAGIRGANLEAERFPEAGPALGLRVHLGQKDLLYVVDGQHRRMGIDNLLEFLKVVRQEGLYPKSRIALYPFDDRKVTDSELAVWERAYEVSRTVCTVGVEAHLGLDVQQERQLFHDLNNKTKKVEVSLALEFDSSNPVNQFIKEKLVQTGVVKLLERGDKVDWDSDHTGVMTRKELVAVNAHLFLNKSNINGARADDVDVRMAVAQRFWEAVTQAEGFGETNARQVTVLAQPVMLKALAKLTHDFAFGKKSANPEHLDTLLDGLTNLDLKHENPIWRYYEMNEAERMAAGIAGLAAYLPTAAGNRDIGAYDQNAKVMRFGSKHNDIFPILGDMIRFSLGLPSRHGAPELAATSA